MVRSRCLLEEETDAKSDRAHPGFRRNHRRVPGVRRSRDGVRRLGQSARTSADRVTVARAVDVPSVVFCLQDSTQLIMAVEQSVHESVDALLEGSRAEIQTVLARYRIPLRDAEDLVQDSFLALIYKYDTVRDPSAWFLGTLRNRCKLYWRQHRVRRSSSLDEVLESALAEPPSQEQSELRQDLGKVIQKVSNTCRSALEMHYLEGLTYQETAVRLGSRPNGIYKVMQRCLASLAKAMRKT